MTTPTPNRTSSSDAIPVLPPPEGKQAFTLSRRTVSGLDHDISTLVKELEALGIDFTQRQRD